MMNLFTRKAMAVLSVGFLTFATLAPASTDSIDEDLMLEQDQIVEMADSVDEMDFDADGSFHPGHAGHAGPHLVCYARNARGFTFEARGRNRFRTQERAMVKCRERSLVCRPLGCNRGF